MCEATRTKVKGTGKELERENLQACHGAALLRSGAICIACLEGGAKFALTSRSRYHSAYT